MVEEVTLGQVFLGVLWAFAESIISPMLHISASITHTLSLSLSLSLYIYIYIYIYMYIYMCVCVFIYIHIILTTDSVDDTHKIFTHVERFKLTKYHIILI